MNTTELIALINKLSLGNDDLTSIERAMHLDYLNLANNDLYIIGSSCLSTIAQDKDIFINGDGISFDFPADVFVIRSVATSRFLKKGNMGEMENIPSDKYLVYGNKIILNKNRGDYTYNVKTDPSDNTLKSYITIVYAPYPKKLTENVTDPASETNVPFLPAPFHHFLAIGALYYFYFPNKVFYEKMPLIRERWENAKKEFRSYCEFSL